MRLGGGRVRVLDKQRESPLLVNLLSELALLRGLRLSEQPSMAGSVRDAP